MTKKYYKRYTQAEKLSLSQKKYDIWIKEQMIKHEKEIEDNIKKILKEKENE